MWWPPWSPRVTPPELYAYGGAEKARVAHERIDLIIKARDGEALERRIEGDLEVALVGEVLAPDLEGPLTIGGADADARIQHSIASLYLARVQIGARVVRGVVLLIGTGSAAPAMTRAAPDRPPRPPPTTGARTTAGCSGGWWQTDTARPRNWWSVCRVDHATGELSPDSGVSQSSSVRRPWSSRPGASSRRTRCR